MKGDNQPTNKSLHQIVQAFVDYKGFFTLEGNPLDRSIKIQGETLDIAESLQHHRYGSGFDWGYVGGLTAQLSLAIALVLENDVDKAVQMVKPIQEAVVAILPQEHFSVRIHYKELKKALQSKEVSHAFNFTDLVHTGVTFSKWLDLPFLPFKSYRFSPESLEYQQLEELQKLGYLNILRDYYTKCTHRKNPTNLSQILVMDLQKIGDVYIAKNAFGRGVGYGHKPNTYQILEG